MLTHKASCSCGQLHLECEGEILRQSICHCLACQKRTGSVFGAQARFHQKNVKIHGISKRYDRPTDEGDFVSFYFCPECGSTVYWEIEDAPGAIIVAVGAFGDPTFPAPEFSVYETRKHAWVTIPSSVKERWD